MSIYIQRRLRLIFWSSQVLHWLVWLVLAWCAWFAMDWVSPTRTVSSSWFWLILSGLVVFYLLKAGGDYSKNIVDQLNRISAFEHSAELLFRGPENSLQKTQQRRIEQRMSDYPIWTIFGTFNTGIITWLMTKLNLVLIFISLVWVAPLLFTPPTTHTTKESTPCCDSISASIALRQQFPQYLQQPVKRHEALSTNAVVGSELIWTVKLSKPMIKPYRLAMIIDERIELVGDAISDTQFEFRHQLIQSMTYRFDSDRIELDADTYQIKAVYDTAPIVNIYEPSDSLILIESRGLTSFQLSVAAEDDYGLNELSIKATLARGGGENVRFTEQVLADRSFEQTTSSKIFESVDLIKLGMQPGDELYLFAEVSDNRKPQPNITRSNAIIFRWPDQDTNLYSDVEGVAFRVMPEYFRSQRQIIIDTQALIENKAKYSEEEWINRSNNIAADQKLLRLRYGRFLGMEDEGFSNAPVVSDSHGLEEAEHEGDNALDHASDHTEHKKNVNQSSEKDHQDAQQDESHHDEHHEEHDHEDNHHEDTHHEDDHHDHADSVERMLQPVSEQQQVLEQYGHTHDYSENATLFDESTKGLLRTAVQYMWDAEKELRIGQPSLALPHENNALIFIKRVQQASRVYLKRMGFEPPAIDFDKRLTGELDTILDRQHSITRESSFDISDQVMQVVRGFATPEQIQALLLKTNLPENSQWLSVNPYLIRLTQQPGCFECKQALQRLVWSNQSDPAARLSIVNDSGEPE